MHEHPHLLVTRPVEPHSRRRSADAAVHLGDWNGTSRLALDLVEQSTWDSRCKGEHVASIALPASRNRTGSAPNPNRESK
jgi:hypothetical protein